MLLREVLIGLLCLGNASVANADEPISFNRDVRPLLSDRCFHCHGRDAENQGSELRLDTREAALADLGGTRAIVPGNLEQSELHRRIRSTGDDQMPPAESVRQLTEAEKDILDRWIVEGAKFESHWSFQPVRERVPVSTVDDEWVRNDIDRFVIKRMGRHDLKPNAESSREKWLRRVSFDLTGLPPTLAELDAFLADQDTVAYEKVVTRLLNSVAFAERMTTEWLDVARYSDTYGYQTDHVRFVWPWRDWVLRAFQDNLPYDQFITWQIAGDLLPAATSDQRLATAFNRLHSHKKEGGSSEEEFRIENVADRTQTFAAAFMGLTFECAKCHDHKYDPISTREFYELSAFFSNIDERGMISFFTDATPTPAMSLPTEDDVHKLDVASAKIRDAEDALQKAESHTESAFAEWLNDREPNQDIRGHVAHFSFEQFLESDSANQKPDHMATGHNQLVNMRDPRQPASTTNANRIVRGHIGNAILLSGDDPVDIPMFGQFSREHPSTFALWIRPAEVTDRGVIYRRSRGWDDAGSIGYELTKEGARLSAKMVHFWPGNAICVETDEILKPDEWTHVAVTYDGSSTAEGLRIYINGRLEPTTIVQDRLTRQIIYWDGGFYNLAIGSRYRDRGFKAGAVDEFHVFDRELSAIEIAQLDDGISMERLLEKPQAGLSKIERRLLFEFFISSVDEPTRLAREQLQWARNEWSLAMDSIPSIMVMREADRPRTTYVLNRGAFDNRGDPVAAQVPAFLPPIPDNSLNDRLGLARWLTSDQHPLTARVTVNRYWQMLFGRGIVSTPEDFGRQGSPPTHPELLDWLARDFMDGDWNVRELLRKIVLSASYRQDSVVDLSKRERDPENMWIARGPGQRLSAEMIRDNALFVSGLLCTNEGGPPVKPYDLSLSFKPTGPDSGEALFRRSLYTFWQRTAPAPIMMVLNANKRDVCRLRREETASPLQAFVLLNGPQFVEASRVFAENLIRHDGDDIHETITGAFRSLTSRVPTKEETGILASLYNEQLDYFRRAPDRANEVLACGSSEPATEIAAARLAAATIVVNAILNLDESVRK